MSESKIKQARDSISERFNRKGSVSKVLDYLRGLVSKEELESDEIEEATPFIQRSRALSDAFKGKKEESDTDSRIRDFLKSRSR